MSKHTVLFELGCEELPPKSLKTLRDALKAETVKGLITPLNGACNQMGRLLWAGTAACVTVVCACAAKW